MSEVSGILQDVQSRSVAGGKTAFDIVVAGQKYGAGFFKPKANVGDYVTFTASQNGNFKNVERGTLKASANKPASAEVQQATTRAAVGKAVNSFDNRQDTISRQAAANTAIAWVQLLHAAGALNIPASKKGQAMAILDTLRQEYEVKFYEANTGTVWKDISPNPSGDSDVEDVDAEDTETADTPWE